MLLLNCLKLKFGNLDTDIGQEGKRETSDWLFCIFHCKIGFSFLLTNPIDKL